MRESPDARPPTKPNETRLESPMTETFRPTAEAFPYKWRIFLALQGKPKESIYSGSVRNPEKSRRRAAAKAGRRAARLNRG